MSAHCTGSSVVSSLGEDSDEPFARFSILSRGLLPCFHPLLPPSSYGTPTDVKVRGSSTSGNYRTIDLSFSTLSQSTQTEIPRRARVVATIPEGTQQAVMLVGSASASRWNSGGSREAIARVAESFRAVPAPSSSLRMRAKERRTG